MPSSGFGEGNVHFLRKAGSPASRPLPHELRSPYFLGLTDIYREAPDPRGRRGAPPSALPNGHERDLMHGRGRAAPREMILSRQGATWMRAAGRHMP